MADFTKAIELEPNYADAYSARGRVYSVLLDFPRAFADFTKAD
ncbi:MAG: hypothetical protein HC784_04175 [Hydrococcus sp. CSU_1_8]|nr:hypothetical protein [Hydrococcus sp. CSU_1_8]